MNEFGLAGNTILTFKSDNGPDMQPAWRSSNLRSQAETLIGGNKCMIDAIF